ncbi:hypothetical protein [Megalodesulfovibrio gigas]|uniref:Uncharacterized protein n=1 Tax=Megalodesulfovibrio gigas (strain ATCC 19364 / DSM 1382 / NCIMB 9332 / VKM B-1759) TaxID=1121448 RepID=T2G6X4_MEGG1|nr:hypothetical protein [Megalodesulfovibrio gigas]AGW11949.1 hypothetical protein DGI_0007 [Megalodesulfovibrio gigas DSM 1382 = ATCC 19364]
MPIAVRETRGGVQWLAVEGGGRAQQANEVNTGKVVTLRKAGSEYGADQ